LWVIERARVRMAVVARLDASSLGVVREMLPKRV
jgi:hypothetical protein